MLTGKAGASGGKLPSRLSPNRYRLLRSGAQFGGIIGVIAAVGGNVSTVVLGVVLVAGAIGATLI